MNHRLKGGFIKKGRLIYQYQTYGLNTTHFLEAVEIYIFFRNADVLRISSNQTTNSFEKHIRDRG